MTCMYPLHDHSILTARHRELLAERERDRLAAGFRRRARAQRLFRRGADPDRIERALD